MDKISMITLLLARAYTDKKTSEVPAVIQYKGVTTTALSDGATTNPITINGSSYTAVNGDTVFYDGVAYTFDGTVWQETVSLAQIITELEGLDEKIGDLSDLTTTDKDSVVDAINELVTAVGGKQDATDNNLQTTDKTIVGAINEVKTGLSGKQDTLTFDDTPTDNSNNPVKSNGVYDALALKQDKTDNTLQTTSKTVAGAVNELKSGLTNVSSDIAELQAYTGYSSTDIIGIEVDYVNKSFRRLGAAVGKNGGSDFDSFSMFGGRRRCNVADDGTISKYYGDTGYAENGSNGQVMVYQPKFYYKVVPLKLEKQSTGKGYHIRKAAYYVTATPMKGFKVHPAFVNASGNEVDYILVGASKGCIYDVSESAYITDDAQVMDNTADKFSSIFGVKPASGLTQDLTRPKIEQMCQNRGANWHELNVQMTSMTQLLMLIEYGKFDMQRAIGKGVVDIADNGSYNCGATSGSTSALGNASGRATSTTIVTNISTTYTDDGKTSVTYRGEEDPYGDMWEFVMGMNIYGNGSMNGGEPYICSDYNYAESKNTDNYKGAGFTVANSDGYVNAWGYGSEDFDWLFIASEVGGSDALPVGDYLWKSANLNGYRIALVGARWGYAWAAGGFSWRLGDAVGTRARNVAGRLAYIPA